MLFCTFISFTPDELRAQNKTGDCKPLRRANRDKSWQFNSYSVLESEYHTDGNKIRRIHQGKTDSIYIYDANGELVTAFLCDQNGRILSPLRLNYVAEGSALTDSIVPGEGGHSNHYFNGLLHSEDVRLTEHRLGGTKRYYDSNGKDSLWSVHTSGKLRLMTWYRNGKDSLQRRWDEQGRLEYEKTGHNERIWDAGQNLVQRSFDTLVQDKVVQCKKTWYPTGILASVTYHYFEQPCLTWKYYNEKGKLVEQVRQEDLDRLGPLGTVEAPQQVYRMVDQNEEVISLFKQDLNPQLSSLLCRTQVKPNGSYLLQVWMDVSGKLTLKDIQGAYADAIKPEMETIFRELPRARPAKKNGTPYARLLKVTLEVKIK